MTAQINQDMSKGRRERLIGRGTEGGGHVINIISLMAIIFGVGQSFASEARRPENLLEIDFTQRSELVGVVQVLNASFQMLRPPTPKELRLGRIATRTEYGKLYTYGCSGSFISDRWIALATHCFQRINDQTLPEVLIRNHRWEVVSGRLVHRGYQDYRFRAGGRKVVYFDAILFEIEGGSPPHRLELHRLRLGQGVGKKLWLVGYPANAYAVPHVSSDCTLLRWETRRKERRFFSDCLLVGGMSGGPQVLADTIELWGTNASSQRFSDGRIESMSYQLPRLPRLK